MPSNAFPAGIEYTSRQILAGGVTWSHGFHVVLSLTSMWHCPGPAAPVVYTGVPLGSFAFGSNTSTTWNGLMWMWKGWAIFGPKLSLTTFHSSARLSSTGTPT